MKMNFSFEIRQAMQVAFAVAEEVMNNMSKERSFGERREHEVRPVLLGIRGKTPTFHFEGGVVIVVNMIELSQFDESWRHNPEEWRVIYATVRYYSSSVQEESSRISSKKIEEVWDAEKLLALKKARPWWHPHVVSPESIKGRVCVFWDNGAAEGSIEADPDYNNEGFASVAYEVEYARFIPGDLKRAIKEARELLRGLYDRQG